MSVCCRKPRVFFSSEWPPLHLWVMRVYIVWVKGKKVTLKNPLDRMFHEYFAGRPYPRDTCEIDSLARLFSFQSCASHMSFSQEPFSRAGRKMQWSSFNLSLYQLNTKLNKIKSHKIQRTKLKQLQHFLSWNKANIKHSCKSQFYILSCRSSLSSLIPKPPFLPRVKAVKVWRLFNLPH